jgi:tetratricopeptide (TPR) repeat protein
MSDPTFTFEYIEQYLDGRLSPEAMAAFEQEVAKNPDLAREVEAVKDTYKAAEVLAQLETRKQVGKLFAETQSSGRKAPRWIMGIAAGFSILLAGAYLFAYLGYSDQTLAQKAFVPYPDRITTMGDATTDFYKDGMQAYNEGRYEEAITLFRLIPDTVVNYDAIELYLGISLLQNGQLEEGEQQLSKVNQKKNAYSEASRWYLALSLVQQGKTKEARPLLEAIVESESYQNKQARQLLRKLNSPLRQLPGI